MGLATLKPRQAGRSPVIVYSIILGQMSMPKARLWKSGDRHVAILADIHTSILDRYSQILDAQGR